MDNLERKRQADEFLYKFRLLNKLKEYGEPHIIGSYAMDMMAWNDKVKKHKRVFCPLFKLSIVFENEPANMPNCGCLRVLICYPIVGYVTIGLDKEVNYERNRLK